MNTVSRHSRAGQVFGDLRKKAKEQSRPVSELLTLYALEGFLGRLSESAEDRGTFVLKGECCSVHMTHVDPPVMLTYSGRT